ncbi:MAG: phosphate/phosphite/phosphonate ABC transporter substrate-binding protein [Rhodocyclaceae bacterium]|nr:phosphate/phosphite/phosphonate ABC transporter substrate-binding protein [Rhodocyclaceae bacterium]
MTAASTLAVVAAACRRIRATWPKAAFALTACACLAGVAANAIGAGPPERVLTVGVVPQFTADRIDEIWRPLLEEVGRRSGVRLELLPSPNIPAFEDRFEKGEFDLVYLNPYHQIIADRTQGYRPILKDRSRLLSGIVVVRKDDPIKNVAELNGAVVAFPAPNALGASMMVRAALANRFGISIVPRYVRTHTSVYLNTLLGESAAGGGIMATFAEQPPEIRDALRILYQTDGVAPHPISVHPRIPGAIARKLTEAFLRVGETAAGREMLAGIPIGEIGEASQEDYLPLTAMGLDAVYEK